MNVSQLNLKTVNSAKDGECIMVGGSLDMSSDVFQSCIAPAVDVTIARNLPIRVGCAPNGADEMLQRYCAEKSYHNVTVYIPQDTDEAVMVASTNFKQVVVPGSFKKRDAAMRKDCKHIVTALSQYGSTASGTTANLISIAAANGEFGSGSVTEVDGYAITKYLRQYLLPYDNDAKITIAYNEGVRAKK